MRQQHLLWAALRIKVVGQSKQTSNTAINSRVLSLAGCGGTTAAHDLIARQKRRRMHMKQASHRHMNNELPHLAIGSCRPECDETAPAHATHRKSIRRIMYLFIHSLCTRVFLCVCVAVHTHLSPFFNYKHTFAEYMTKFT